MSKHVLGLDIRHNAVTAVLVKSGIKGNWIDGHIYVPMAEPFPPSEEGIGRAL